MVLTVKLTQSTCGELSPPTDATTCYPGRIQTQTFLASVWPLCQFFCSPLIVSSWIYMVLFPPHSLKSRNKHQTQMEFQKWGQSARCKQSCQWEFRWKREREHQAPGPPWSEAQRIACSNQSKFQHERQGGSLGPAPSLSCYRQLTGALGRRVIVFKKDKEREKGRKEQCLEGRDGEWSWESGMLGRSGVKREVERVMGDEYGLDIW